MVLDLMICRIPGLKGEETIKLVKKFNSADELLRLSKKDLENFIGRIIPDHDYNPSQVLLMAEKDYSLAEKLGIHIVSFREEAYPPLAREIFDPPAVLFYRGVLPQPEKPLVAMVGTRKPTSAGAARAFALGRELGEAGIPVVSGLALGIDSMSHMGNIEGGAPTVAVLGSSPDLIYPYSNRGLARRILEIGGAIISEYPPGTRPFRWNFPVRNRIISAISRGVVIVEAPVKSGALITARFAIEHNRDLWIDKAGLASPMGAGAAILAEDGAKEISSAKDILVEWNIAVKEKGSGENKTKKTSPGEGTYLASSLAEQLEINL